MVKIFASAFAGRTKTKEGEPPVLQRLCAFLALAVFLVACASAPPQFVEETHSPLLNQAGGPLLVTDACMKESTLVGDNYFVVSKARADAKALNQSVASYLGDNGVDVGTKRIPFVCGAIGPGDEAWKVADHIDAPRTSQKWPFAVAGALQSDPEYADSLAEMSAYVFKAAVIKSLTKDREVQSQAMSKAGLDAAKFQKAAAIIEARTHHASLLYVGVAGNRVSAGRRLAEDVGRVAVGTAIGVATMGVVNAGGTSYGFAVVPGGSSNGWQMVAGLVDLQSGKLTWSAAIHGGSDPMKPKNLTQPATINLLLKGLFYKPTNEWRPPGAPPQ